ncbi:MAG: DUF3267 domain-containing protein [Ruminococcaceae bacterium]|nr:DUF3267 domain-containing protein [Oscillospiraceae bacterium]
MYATQHLPAHYTEALRIDLKNNKRQFYLVYAISFLILAVFLVPVCFFRPIAPLFEGLTSGDPLPVFLRLATLCAGLFAYIVLHELVHGVFIRIFTGKRARYGFSLAFAYAYSDCYFTKWPYLVIALAPVIFWGVILAILTPVVPLAWFWVVYIIQLTNLSGAAGDLYVTVRLWRLPRHVLIKDDGTAMTVYTAAEH